ncbi:MAG: hypothetical protein PHF63_09460 [Herbinix sp.]|nr:hypothetical protein [Herbinix sp.]
MADQDFNHTADIIKAALPFVDSKTKGMAELFAKILDLMGSLKSVGNSGNLAAYGFQGSKIDVEGLLKGVRPVLDIKEREIVDRILNIFNMKRMFEMYNNMMSAMKTMQEFGGFPSGDSGNDAENVAGNFSGLNFESIFQSFGNNFSSEGSKNTTNTNDSENTTNHFEYSDTSTTEEAPASDFNKDTTSSSFNSGSGKNNMMFDMLKTMIPPEQISTFENLSMLLNTMSYDNNSKSDDSKECSDG